MSNAGHEVVIIRPVYNPETSRIHSKRENIREIEYSALSNQEYFENMTEAEDGLLFKSLSPLSVENKRFGEIFHRMLLNGCESRTPVKKQ